MYINNADLELLKSIALSYYSEPLCHLISKLEYQKAMSNAKIRVAVAERRKADKNYARSKNKEVDNG